MKSYKEFAETKAEKLVTVPMYGRLRRDQALQMAQQKADTIAHALKIGHPVHPSEFDLLRDFYIAATSK